MKTPLQAAADIVDNALMYRMDGNGNYVVPQQDLDCLKKILAEQLLPGEIPEWAKDNTRMPWVRNSLRHRVTELRKAATRCRTAYQQPYMKDPAAWLSGVYDRAADVLASAAELIGEKS